MQVEAEHEAETKPELDISSTMKRCFAMITEAQDHFVLLQKNRKYHRSFGRPVDSSLFDVRAVLMKTVRFFQISGECATSIEVDRGLSSFFSNPNYIRQILHEIIYSLRKSSQCGRIWVRACLNDMNVLQNRRRGSSDSSLDSGTPPREPNQKRESTRGRGAAPAMEMIVMQQPTGETGKRENSSSSRNDEQGSGDGRGSGSTDSDAISSGGEEGVSRMLVLQVDVEWRGKVSEVDDFSEMMGTAAAPRTSDSEERDFLRNLLHLSSEGVYMMRRATALQDVVRRVHELGGYVENAWSSAAKGEAIAASASQKDTERDLSPLYSVKIFVPPGEKPRVQPRSTFANASDRLLEDARGKRTSPRGRGRPDGSKEAVRITPPGSSPSSSPSSAPPSPLYLASSPLPAANASACTSDNILRASSSACPRVLVVDDNDFCREFVASQIRLFIGRDRCVVNGVGTSASAALDHLLTEKEYDLVLMDMSMPGAIGDNAQSGIWVTRQYKMKRPESVTRFICLSGMGHDAVVVTACKDAGMVSPYALGKPFNKDEMLQLLSATFPQFVSVSVSPGEK